MTAAEEARVDIRGGVEIELGGKKVWLLFDLGGQIALQKEAEIDNISAAIVGIGGPFDAALWRAVLWAGQLHIDPDLKIGDLDKIIIRGDDTGLRVRVLAALENVVISEEELQILGDDLQEAAKIVDPFVLLREGAKLAAAKMEETMAKVRSELSEIVSRRSSEQQASSEFPTPNSGNSPPANSTGDSGAGENSDERGIIE